MDVFYENAKVSSVTICRNEINIAAMIDSLIGVVDEIVIVDTGSTDNTLEVLDRYCDVLKVYHFPWCDDFSAARNYAIKMAANDWVLIIDADEVLIETYKESLRDSIKKLDVHILACPEIININSFNIYNVCRLFNKKSESTFRGNVHEYVHSDSGVHFFLESFKIIHSGYSVASLLNDKKKRNLSLLMINFHREPLSSRWNYYLLNYNNASESIKKSCIDYFLNKKTPFIDGDEIYCLNGKIKSIIYLLHIGEFHMAHHEISLIIDLYKSREISMLHFLCLYFSYKEGFFISIREIFDCLNSIRSLDSDIFILQDFNANYISHLAFNLNYDLKTKYILKKR